MIDIKVPELAESIAEATLLEWQLQPGEAVKKDDILVELETDKVVLEIPAPVSGVLVKILKVSGENVSSNEVLAMIDETASVNLKTSRTREQSNDDVSPSVRRLLTELDLKPSDIPVPGSGKDGRLLKKDVQEFLQTQQPEAVNMKTAPVSKLSPPQINDPDGTRREPMSHIRRAVANHLLNAQQNAAILTTFNEIDMSAVMALRKEYQEPFQQQHGVKLGFMSFFTRASVQALKKFPQVNAFIDGNDMLFHDYQHIGIAIGSTRGLVVPVIKHADRLSLADIEKKIIDFAERAGNGKLLPDELSDGTFTITNGGVYGSLLSTPILNPPQSAILGMHKIEQRPVAVEGQVVIRPIMYVALSYDHRIIDGRDAVQFLVTIKEELEDPSRLLLGL